MIKRLFFGMILVVLCAQFAEASSDAGGKGTGLFDKKIYIAMQTSEGDVIFELWPDVAPKGVENFIGLVNSGLYNDDKFWRLEPGKVIQFGAINGVVGYKNQFGAEFSRMKFVRKSTSISPICWRTATMAMLIPTDVKCS